MNTKPGHEVPPGLDPVVRRRIQNRNAQRRFRSKRSSLNAAASSKGAAACADESTAVTGCIPIQPRPVSKTSEEPTASTGPLDKTGAARTMRSGDGGPQLPACRPIDTSSLPSPLSSTYNSAALSPAQGAMAPPRLEETFAEYFGQLLDAGDSMLFHTPQAPSPASRESESVYLTPGGSTSSTSLADAGIPSPTNNTLHDAMQWPAKLPPAGHPFATETGYGAPRTSGHGRDSSSARRGASASISHRGGLASFRTLQHYPHAICYPGIGAGVQEAACQQQQQQQQTPPEDTTAMETSDFYDSDGDEPFQSSLHIAAYCGHQSIVDMVLAAGSTAVDERDSDGNTALHVAVLHQKLAVVGCLLKYGAKPNAENAAGWTPVHLAVSTGSVDLVEALVRHGGDLGKMARAWH